MISYPLLCENDKELYDAVMEEASRQRNKIELIASENFVSEAVMEANSTILTNKYAEGYPGRRYYGEYRLSRHRNIYFILVYHIFSLFSSSHGHILAYW